MQQTPNFNSRQIISKEELRLWDESLRELVGNVLRYNRNSELVGGSLDAYDPNTSLLINDFFKVELGSVQIGGYNTLKIGFGRGILNFENTTLQKVSGLTIGNNSLQRQLVTLLKWEATDNIPVDGIEGYNENDEIYVGFIPIWNPLENGLCSISSSNQVTITNGDFTKLRGQSTKNPSKVRFYKEDGTPAINSEVYEVISIVDSSNIIISGVVSNESNLKFMIVGSYDLEESGSLSDKFSYVTANGKLMFTNDTTDITGAGGFIIAKLVFGTGGAFTVVDLRGSYLFNFAYSPDIVYKSLVQTITGRKTFSSAVPSFASFIEYFLNVASSTSPIGLVDYGGGSTSMITIPDEDGSLFYITSGTAAGVFNKIVCEKTVLPGTSLFLKVDDSSDDISTYVHIDGDPVVAWSIKSNNYARFYEAPQVKLSKGSIVHLILDKDNVWNLVNIGSDRFEEAWTQVLEIYDSGANLVSNSTNKAFYKFDRNRVVLVVEVIALATSLPATFSLPFTFEHKVVEQIQSYTNNDMDGSITIDTDGTVTIDSDTGIGNCNKSIIIYK